MTFEEWLGNQIDDLMAERNEIYAEIGQECYDHGYDQGRVDVIDEIKELIKSRLIGELGLEEATKYDNKNAKQQANSYATVMKYEIADCVDDLLDDLEQLKENKNDK